MDVIRFPSHGEGCGCDGSLIAKEVA